MRILIVDDDPVVTTIVSMVLEEAGYEVTIAESGEQAMQVVAGDAGFDAVVSDLNMPGIDGIELCQRLRAGGFGSPFILLSGEDPKMVRHRAPELSECLAKDETLFETIAEAVARALAAGKG